MWILNTLPEQLPAIDSEISVPELEISRLHCNSLSESQSYTQIIDCNTQYINQLLQYSSEHTNPVISEQICIASINAAYGYEQLAQQIRESAYSDDSNPVDSQQWQSSTNYNKRAIGLLQFASSVPMISIKLLTMCNQYASLYRLNQQLSMVLLTISKMRTRLYPAGKDKYSTLLSFQDSDLQSLSAVSMPYAKLAIGCSGVCDSIQHSIESVHLKTQVLAMKRFLDCLSLALLSIFKYDKENDTDAALDMINTAIANIRPLLSKDQVNLLQNNKSLEKILVKTKFWKESIKDKLKNKKWVHSKKSDKDSNSSYLHPFILEVIADFLLPLIMVLKVRYDTTNEFIFDNVGSNSSHNWVLPQGKAPEVKGVRFFFDGSTLTVDQQAESENLR